MENDKTTNGPAQGKTGLWMFLVLGIILAAVGLLIPQHYGHIDVGGIEVLTGVLLAIGAVISILVS